ncbi:SigE family RNA polymerase sigma factor [Dactylosporangium sp. CS-047395]|uniref:SigE family RNA polymerase sigma factor n=1 Tax=Dactylosporangium sp. CS-047395 TaxID=3239936 RepID=UPI003D8CE6EE
MEFEEFAQARLPALLRYAALLSGDRELARDLVQEVLTRALVRWRRIGAVAEPYAYVRTMVTNEFLSMRRRRVLPTIALSGTTTVAQADRTGELGEREDLWHRLAQLPRQQRAVLVLRYYEDLTDQEIADVLACRPATVRAYAARALATLRISLAAEESMSTRNLGAR